MYLQITKGEVNYLLDLFKEIKGGLNDGVMDEIEQAEELLQEIVNRIPEEAELLEEIKKLEG